MPVKDQSPAVRKEGLVAIGAAATGALVAGAAVVGAITLGRFLIRELAFGATRTGTPRIGRDQDDERWIVQMTVREFWIERAPDGS
jgi:hypothetical protein